MDARDFILQSYKIPKKDVYKKGKICAKLALDKGYTKAQIIDALKNTENLSRGFQNGILKFLRDHN